MNELHVLDCTLRDGGYCNDWNFGFENIKQIINGLIDANIDIVECGFITNKESSNLDRTKYTSIDDFKTIIPRDRNGKLFVAMMNYGEYDIENLPYHDGTSIDGIRVAFHKKNVNEALEVCRRVKEKGYYVFIQAMLSLSYSDEEFLSLIRAVNTFDPYAFYIVDSFGMMKEKDLVRLFYMVEHNLNYNIRVGFHSHNNLQLAYSNAQRLVTIQTNRNIIIDASVMGMGRGAGNLNTELFVDYLNENVGKEYYLKPLLTIVDKILTPFFIENSWGYSLPNYISASHCAHPNYASYLDAKNTLTFEAMNDIFDMMDEDKKATFDKAYIEELYLKYQERDRAQEDHLSELLEKVSDGEVLIIAPGKSSLYEKEKLLKDIGRNKPTTISISYDYDENLTDYIFISNLRRYRDLPNNKREKCIVTSNIQVEDAYLQVNYKDLLNDDEIVKDNSGLMLIKLLIQLGVKRIYLAGMDGYSLNPDDNYVNKDLNIVLEKKAIEAKNEGLNRVLKAMNKDVEIIFVTTPKYVRL